MPEHKMSCGTVSALRLLLGGVGDHRLLRKVISQRSRKIPGHREPHKARVSGSFASFVLNNDSWGVFRPAKRDEQIVVTSLASKLRRPFCCETGTNGIDNPRYVPPFEP